MTINNIIDKVTEASIKLQIAKETSEHLHDMINEADTSTQENTALFFACNQSTISTFLTVILDYVNDANEMLEEIEESAVSENKQIEVA